MFEVTFLIPVQDNSGEVFSTEHHSQFEAELLDKFGGFTRLGANAVGGWRDEERVYADHLILYVVAVRSITEGAKVGDVATFAKVHYRQVAIYVRYLGLSEIL